MSIKIDDQLQGVRAKIRWAKKHFVDLQGAIQTFLAQNPYRIEPVNYGTVLTLYGRVLLTPPEDISLMIGDLLNNLRSPLDYMIPILMRANGRDPGEWTPGFPIVAEKEKYDKHVRHSMQVISVKAKEVVESLQPFNHPTPQRAPLWMLRQLNNPDKHQRPTLAGFAADLRGIGLGEGSIDFLTPEELPLIVRDREPLQQFFGLRGNATVEFKFDVAFADADGPAYGARVIPAMDHLVRVVEGEVIPALVSVLDPPTGTA